MEIINMEKKEVSKGFLDALKEIKKEKNASTKEVGNPLSQQYYAILKLDFEPACRFREIGVGKKERAIAVRYIARIDDTHFVLRVKDKVAGTSTCYALEFTMSEGEVLPFLTNRVSDYLQVGKDGRFRLSVFRYDIIKAKEEKI